MATGSASGVRGLLPSVLRRWSGPVGWADVRHRFATWRWPAFQMAVAGAVAYLVADAVVSTSASYAPITALVAIGFGRERRLERGIWVVAGLAFGVVIAELAAAWLGGSWWAVGIVLGISALLAGLALDAELAVSYAAINAGVLLAIPGSEGWVPGRAVSAVIGVVVGVAILLLVLPPSPDRQLRQRLERLADAVAEAATVAAGALRDGVDDWNDGDDRASIAAARRIDDEIERSHSTADHARQMSRWSPLRRARPGDTSALRDLAHELRPALRTMSTIVRLCDRMLLHDVPADERTVAAIDEVGTVTATTIRCLVAQRSVDDEVDERARALLGELAECTPTHGAEIAVHEELRGILNDLRAVVGRRSDGGLPDREDLAHDAGGVRFGPR